MMEIYKESLKYVELSQPTLFSPIINTAKDIAQQFKEQGSLNYLILLILTDGDIHDMDKVINSLVEAAILPISIIIVGIGKANFEKMHQLDGEKAI